MPIACGALPRLGVAIASLEPAGSPLAFFLGGIGNSPAEDPFRGGGIFPGRRLVGGASLHPLEHLQHSPALALVTLLGINAFALKIDVIDQGIKAVCCLAHCVKIGFNSLLISR